MKFLDFAKDSISKEMPEYNPDIADGVAYSQMNYENLEEYIDINLRCWVNDLNKDFEYLGYQRCEPWEAIKVCSSLPNCPNLIAVEKNDVYLIKVKLRYKGKDFEPKYIMLPLVNRGGVLTIRGASYFLYGIVADNFFSVDGDSIHITLTKTKFYVRTVDHSFNLGTLQTTGKCLYAQLYSVPANDQPKGSSKRSLLVNYFGATFGITNSLRNYFGVGDFYFGLDGIDVRDPSNPVDIFSLDTKKYHICTSAGDSAIYARKVMKISKSPFVFAINKEEYERPGIKEFITSLFFMFDRLFDGSNPKAATFHANEHLDNPTYWQRVLVFFLFRQSDREREFMNKIRTHLNTVSGYIETVVQRRLKNENLPINDMWELMAYLIENYLKILSKHNPADCSNKYIVSTPYALYNIIHRLTNLTYDFNSLVNRGQLSEKSIKKTLSKFPTDAILSIGSSNFTHYLDMANDCMPMKITTSVMPQAKASVSDKERSNSDRIAKDPQNKTHPSMIDVFTYLSAIKSNPTGRARLNPYLRLEPNGKVKENPNTKAIRDNLTLLMSGKEEQ